MSIRHSSLLVVLLIAAPALAQPTQPATDALHPDAAVARWFAPILWPATYETIWPTIPHALAFDGEDNDGNRLVDLEDVCEVAFGSFKLVVRPDRTCEIDPKPVKKFEVTDVMNGFDTLEVKPPRRVVFFGPTPFESEPIDVLEYWFYYLYDQGPGSHIHDAEHAFVFLDVDRRDAPVGALSRYDALVNPATQLSKAVRVVVAAAHEGSTANNILAAARKPSKSRVVPPQLPVHMPLLAELGKHASAPDLNFDGRFDPGFDANVFRGSLWGMRDSISAGLSEVGFMNFETWQSFPRKPAPISVEASYFLAKDKSVRDSYRIYSKQLAEADFEYAYSVFPMADQQRLYTLLHADGTPDEIERQVLAFLNEHRTCFWGNAAANWSGKISREAWPVMRQWALKPRDHVELWKHDDHRQPKNIFKLHLFPRVALGFGVSSDVGYEPILRPVIEVSDLPWPSFSGWGGLLELLFPGRLLTDSRLEISVLGTEGKVRNWAYQYDSITWKKGRGNRSGVYVGVQRRKAQVLPGSLQTDDTIRQVSVETGVEMDVLRERKGGKGWPGGVRAGIFGGHSFARCLGLLAMACRIEGQMGIVVETRGKPLSDVEQQLGGRQNLRFQWGVTTAWSTPFGRPKPWNH